QPIAPAEDGPMLQPWADSTSVRPARIVQFRPKARAAPCQIGLRTSVPLQGVGAVSPVVTDGLRLRLWLLRPASEASAVTFAFGVAGERVAVGHTNVVLRDEVGEVWKQAAIELLAREAGDGDEAPAAGDLRDAAHARRHAHRVDRDRSGGTAAAAGRVRLLAV